MTTMVVHTYLESNIRITVQGANITISKAV